MRHEFLLAVMLLASVHRSAAQDFASMPDLRGHMLYGGELIPIDTTQHLAVRRLQPENMSVVERALWDDNGFFRAVGLASPLTPEARKSELSLRRGMLTAHQIGGFVTVGLMGTAAYFGQKVIDGHVEYRRNHKLFVRATITSYSVTALLALLSPPPMIRRDEVSTTTIHKALAWVHVAGMILTPILGASINRHASDSQRAHFHQVSAYVTMTALAASMITISL
jgi:hypothetical protein